MNPLWAPWRIEFIEDLRKDTGICIFCEAFQAGEDRERLVLYRGRTCYVIMNRYPYSNGHLLIVPYKHTPSLSDLGADENAEMLFLCARSAEIMSRTIEAEGFNCGFNLGKVAGAGIEDHIHMHLVPRWCGDTNFMPIIGNTRCMLEYLESTYDRLIGDFERI